MQLSPVNNQNVDALRSAIRLNEVSGTFHPAIYVIEPTSRCNVNCIMCPNSQLKDEALGDMSEDKFAHMLKKIAPYAELTMLYFMGEPTLHPQFVSLLALARSELAGKIVVSTNALDLSDSTMSALSENADIVIACIDRWDKDAYEKIRRGSNFEKVIDNVEKLVLLSTARSGCTVIVKTLDIQLPSERQINIVRIEEEERKFDRFWRMRGAVPMSGWLNTWAGQMPNLVNLSRKDTPYTDSIRVACADLWFKMVINWQGDVIMCCHDWSSSYVRGNLLRSSLFEIWHSRDIIEHRARQVQGAYGSNPLCATCKEWGEDGELESYLRLNQEDLYKVF